MTQMTNDYHSFLRALRQAIHCQTFAEFAPITVVYGPCEYLRDKAVAALRGFAQDVLHATTTTVELRDVADEQWEEMLLHRSLLEPKALFVVKANDKLGGLLQFLGRLTGDTKRQFSNRLIIALAQKDLLKVARAAFTQVNAQLICCTAPRPSEEPKFAADLARKFGLNLDSAAINLVLQTVGHNNYHALENELRRLALIFIEQKGSTSGISSQQIAPYLSLLKEEHVFQIDNLILQGQISQAQLLLLDLMNRGEAPIAIIGIIARHCRNAIRVLSGQQGRAPNLPASVLRSYTQYVRKKSSKHFMDVLNQCQLADTQLKTSPIDPGLLISAIIQDLGPSARA